MIKQKLIFIFLIIIFQNDTSAQIVNKYDSQGLRHGLWQKFYEGTKQLRYSGTFDHGKEIGSFKFYDKSGGHPTAVKTYTSGSDLLDVSFYTKSGNLISKGFLKNRNKYGEWLYYHQDGTTLMTKESYVDNKLTGMRIVYFQNGQKAQETQYKNGVKEGKETFYNEKGIVLKEFLYVNDMLEGLAKLYDYDGTISKEGSYKSNRKHGVWKYYNNGKVNKTITFPQNKIGVSN